MRFRRPHNSWAGEVDELMRDGRDGERVEGDGRKIWEMENGGMEIGGPWERGSEKRSQRREH